MCRTHVLSLILSGASVFAALGCAEQRVYVRGVPIEPGDHPRACAAAESVGVRTVVPLCIRRVPGEPGAAHVDILFVDATAQSALNYARTFATQFLKRPEDLVVARVDAKRRLHPKAAVVWSKGLIPTPWLVSGSGGVKADAFTLLECATTTGSAIALARYPVRLSIPADVESVEIEARPCEDPEGESWSGETRRVEVIRGE